MTAYTGAFVIKNALVKFASTEYGNQCTKARLVPDTPTQTVRTLVPDGQVSDTDSTSWVLELEGLQDWETGGLAKYFNDNNGSLVSVQIAPVNTAGKVKATVSARIVPVAFGGEVGEFATFEVELPVQGQPTFGTV